MLLELILVMSIYAIIFLIYLRFKPLIKAMDEMNDFFNEETNDFVDTPKEAAEQRKKREALKDAINQGKAYLLGGKKPWTFERIDSLKDEAVNKIYCEFKQCEIQQQAQATGKAVGKHVINLYSKGVNRFISIKSVERLRQDIEDDIVIKDQMANLGAFLVCTLGPFLAPVLIAAHTLNNTRVLGYNDDEGDESNKKEAEN